MRIRKPRKPKDYPALCPVAVAASRQWGGTWSATLFGIVQQFGDGDANFYRHTLMTWLHVLGYQHRISIPLWRVRVFKDARTARGRYRRISRFRTGGLPAWAAATAWRPLEMGFDKRDERLGRVPVPSLRELRAMPASERRAALGQRPRVTEFPAPAPPEVTVHR